jgi:SPP1 family predicted phage head-tail adaptor
MALVLQGPLAAGKLRTPITIQVNTAIGTVDSRGQELATWATFATGYAQIQLVPRGSREITAAQQTQADQWWDVLTRYIDGVVPKMRLLFGTHVLDIQTAVDPDSRRRRLLMLCLERNAAGTP